ncbi:AIDA repeat-containing protein, partial [Methylophilus sp.]|uniref:AIDA repeat-containing protein n=1 Tax=Methylophilus sp. TaxID=29541 RepID=UPI004037BA8B
MPTHLHKHLKLPRCLLLHSSLKNLGLPGAGSKSAVLNPTSLLLALLCLAGYHAQAADSTVPAGETVKDAVIDNGDEQIVNGKATNTTVRNNAGGSRSSQEVNGIAEDTIVEKGGRQAINTGGTAKNTIVKQGGVFNLKNKSTIENLTVESGGTAYLLAGSIWKGIINYQPGSKSEAGAYLSTTWKMTGDSALNIVT